MQAVSDYSNGITLNAFFFTNCGDGASISGLLES